MSAVRGWSPKWKPRAPARRRSQADRGKNLRAWCHSMGALLARFNGPFVREVVFKDSLPPGGYAGPASRPRSAAVPFQLVATCTLAQYHCCSICVECEGQGSGYAPKNGLRAGASLGCISHQQAVDPPNDTDSALKVGLQWDREPDNGAFTSFPFRKLTVIKATLINTFLRVLRVAITQIGLLRQSTVPPNAVAVAVSSTPVDSGHPAALTAPPTPTNSAAVTAPPTPTKSEPRPSKAGPTSWTNVAEPRRT
ncbi:hypothetical protein GGX14DRAFT_390307 [Mycena pura]|uniref:Uncharacterized protein n=1 Tax=Mycena pura TaxID=153505 RepID=A0AAD6VNV3_9AGAR|nr:hypothetical protein GGX14DRAFT_390307 [Mycena pura]